MSAWARHLNRATLLLSIAIVLGLVAIILPISEASLLSHESTAPVIVPQSAPSGTYFDHLVFIIMENAGISDICGSNLPPPATDPTPPTCPAWQTAMVSRRSTWTLQAQASLTTLALWL